MQSKKSTYLQGEHGQPLKKLEVVNMNRGKMGQLRGWRDFGAIVVALGSFSLPLSASLYVSIVCFL